MLITTEYGKIEITLQTISSIVKKVVQESYGPVNVGSPQQGFLARILGAEEKHGIKVTEEIDGTLEINIELVLEYGVRIPTVVTNIQENVFHRLKLLTEANNVKVNVYVVGLQD
ncbi:MAG: Asp23/Gls24 family envelope stress response protein [Thermotogae bacterium]|nr:Asp23/Gls24 family envelope stress response protein [Kosmotoga sp.]MBO8166363.1 Asp23/Gls24 family envelope stress response protein [Kosmotoga sp.]MCD6159990.1 Asp23/Gls24 family envelope stress response protein [Kosmotoga sp.]RKX47919.1 MAG: Asp23/Gls24 family envelope stress response protein [Thermotogota bacterium]